MIFYNSENNIRDITHSVVHCFVQDRNQEGAGSFSPLEKLLVPWKMCWT